MKTLIGMLLLTVLGTSGCTTRQATWSRSAITDADSAGLLLYKDAREIIKLIALPGDTVLLHLGHSRKDLALSQLAIIPITVADVLDLQDPFTTYLHAEIVQEVMPTGRLRTRGYYPLAKKYVTEQHRNYFSVYRIADPTLQKRPLEKEKARSYPMTGYCGDYVAWTYDNQIYSWWNRVFPLNKLLATLYPPEAIHTPDSLANSPDTIKVLEIFNGEVLFPVAIDPQALIADMHSFATSDNAILANHAQAVINRLQAHASEELIRFEKVK